MYDVLHLFFLRPHSFFAFPTPHNEETHNKIFIDIKPSLIYPEYKEFDISSYWTADSFLFYLSLANYEFFYYGNTDEDQG